METNINEMLIKIQQISSSKNKFQNVAWKMAAILSMPRYVEHSSLHFTLSTHIPALV